MPEYMWSLSKLENPIGSVAGEILTGEQRELYSIRYAIMLT